MFPVPQHRTLLGVDVIGSGKLPGHLMEAIPGTVTKLLDEALALADVEPGDVLQREHTGDGALLVLPSTSLGAALDAGALLDKITIDHNRWHKPEVRLRVAVHVGPIGDEPGYYDTRRTHARLLDAPEFKALVASCQDDGNEETASTALIVSDIAMDTAFSGNHTRVVLRGEFAALPISHKEYARTAWARVPGFNARSLAGFIAPEPAPGSAPEQASGSLNNIVHGNMTNGIQAHTVNGTVNFNAPR